MITHPLPIWRITQYVLSAVIGSLSLLSISTPSAEPPQPDPPIVKEGAKVEEVVEGYYRAESYTALESALAELRTLAPEHYLRWEVEAVHAELTLDYKGSTQAAFQGLQVGTDAFCLQEY